MICVLCIENLPKVHYAVPISFSVIFNIFVTFCQTRNLVISCIVPCDAKFNVNIFKDTVLGNS